MLKKLKRFFKKDHQIDLFLLKSYIKKNKLQHMVAYLESFFFNDQWFLKNLFNIIKTHDCFEVYDNIRSDSRYFKSISHIIYINTEVCETLAQLIYKCYIECKFSMSYYLYACYITLLNRYLMVFVDRPVCDGFIKLCINKGCVEESKFVLTCLSEKILLVDIFFIILQVPMEWNHISLDQLKEIPIQVNLISFPDNKIISLDQTNYVCKYDTVGKICICFVHQITTYIQLNINYHLIIDPILIYLGKQQTRRVEMIVFTSSA
ncbi:hypothetical protein nvc1_017 [Namao virus]|nr:hypothetical protein nvc1_017 [Namao virus]